MHDGSRFQHVRSRIRTNSLRLVGILAIAGGGLTVPVVATAASSLPTVTNFKISVNALPPEGGKFTLSATVTNATSCTFRVIPAIARFPVTVACGAGTGAVAARSKAIVKVINTPMGGNASLTTVHYVFSFSATSATGTSKSTTHPSLTQHAYKWTSTTKALTLKGTATSISCTTTGGSYQGTVHPCVVVSSKGTLAVISTKKSRNTNLTDVFRSVSCASPAMCVAVDSTGTFVTWNGAKWSSPISISKGSLPDLVTISCPVATFCMAGDSSGNMYAFAPNGGPGSHASVFSVVIPVPGIKTSCSSSTSCLVVNEGGDAAAWNGKTWKFLGKVDSTGSVSAVSCSGTDVAPGNAQCTLVDTKGGEVLVRPDGFSEKVADGIGALTVACPTPSYCLVTDSKGNAAQEVNGVWSPPFTIGNDPPVALSCGVGKTSAVGVTCGAVSRPRRGGQMKWGVITLK